MADGIVSDMRRKRMDHTPRINGAETTVTDLGPVRLVAVDESGRKTAWDNGEAVVSSTIAGPPVNWMLLGVRTFRNTRGQVALPYVYVPIQKALEHGVHAWTDFENAFETLAMIVEGQP